VPPNPNATALRAARADNRYLQTLFNRYIGTAEHPRGKLLTAYRHARAQIAALAKAGHRGAEREIREVLRVLEYELRTIGLEVIGDAARRGQASAREQLAGYVEDGATVAVAGEGVDLPAMVNSWMAEYERQRTAALGMLALGTDPMVLIGDAIRPGLLQPAPIAKSGANWISTALGAGVANWLIGRDKRKGAGMVYDKQAIAALDERTTDCCLRVHGQIVPFDKKFKLVGTPRFADELEWSPFHWYCRTSVAMYHEMFEYGETERMEYRAKVELEARAEAQTHIDELKKRLAELGARPDVRHRKDDTDEVKKLRDDLRFWRISARMEIHPAHATSRR